MAAAFGLKTTCHGASNVKTNAPKEAKLVVIHYEKSWKYDKSSTGGAYQHKTEKFKHEPDVGGSRFFETCSFSPGVDAIPAPAWWTYFWEENSWGTNGVGQSDFNELVSTNNVCSDRSNPTHASITMPAFERETCAGGGSRTNGSVVETVSRTTKTIWELRTGDSGSKRPNLFVVTAVATKYDDMFFPEIDPAAVGTGIANTKIQVGALGALDTDGYACAALPDNDTRDVTPLVAGVKYYRHGVGFRKFLFKSQVVCQALSNTNLDRTTLGVGENVSIFFDPYQAPLGPPPVTILWGTTAGTAVPASGAVTFFTAPKTTGNATVTATAKRATFKIDFSTEEPSGIQTKIRGQAESFGIGSVGAGMFVDVTLQPTTVSFRNVQVMEPGASATGRTGYFTNNTPPNHDTAHGANQWHGVTCANLIQDQQFDHAWSSGWPVGQSGSYTFPISPIWRVANDTATHALNGWSDQVHTLSSDGTMRVDKFGNHVIRHINEERGTAE